MWMIQEPNTVELWNRLHFEEEEEERRVYTMFKIFLTFGCRNYFLNFSTPYIKMWIIQEPNTLELWNKLHFEEEEKRRVCTMFKIFLTFGCRNYFLNFSTPYINMWMIQEPNKLELWNKLHFEEKKQRVYTMFKIFSTYICWIKI